jgi:hypothetical protein
MRLIPRHRNHRRSNRNHRRRFARIAISQAEITADLLYPAAPKR